MSIDEPLRLRKQEAFAQYVAAGQTLIEAYEHAGYKPNRANAHHLHARSDVTKRIQQITAKRAEQREKAMAEAAATQRITVETLIAEVEEARVAALRAGQYSAAVAASKEKGVLAGLRVERSERGAPHEFEGTSTADLLRELRELGYDVREGEGETLQ